MRLLLRHGFDRRLFAKPTKMYWVTLLTDGGHLTLCLRPFAWRVAAFSPVPGKEPYRRIYFGPLEVEWH